MAESGIFSFLDQMTFVDDDSSQYEIQVGDQGFSYLNMGSEKAARRFTFGEKQKRQTSAALDGSTRAGGKFNIKKHETVDHSAICVDTDLMAILRDIEERRKKVSIFPLAAVGVGILIATWLALPFLVVGGWVLTFGFVWVPPLLLILLWNVWKLDISRKQVKCTYRLSGQGSSAFEAIDRAVSALRSSNHVLLFAGRRHFEDTRYSGGASNLPEFAEVKFNKKRPPFIDVPFDVWHIRAFHKDLFFMPDHLLVFEGANAGGVSYSRLKLSSDLDVTQARGKAKVTRDCKLAGKTFRFVNNDGTPDQRFNNNVEIPLIEFGVFSLAGAGLDLSFYATKQSAAQGAPDGFAAIQRLGALPVKKIASERRLHRKAPVDRREFQRVLFEVVCCVMVSDGRASKSEKTRIVALMRSVESSWQEDEVRRQIDAFFDHVRESGFRQVLRATCDRLETIKEKNQRVTILECIDAIAQADGRLDEREAATCSRLKQALS